MDVLLVVLVLALIGFGVYLITEKIPMAPLWKTAIQIFALIVCVLFLLRVAGLSLPNVLQ